MFLEVPASISCLIIILFPYFFVKNLPVGTERSGCGSPGLESNSCNWSAKQGYVTEMVSVEFTSRGL